MNNATGQAPAKSTGITEHIDSLKTSMGGPYCSLPRKSTIAVLMKHGGFQIMTKSGAVMTRLKKHMSVESDESVAQAAIALKNKADMFFQRLSSRSYGIPSQLISFITFPHEGTAYTEPTAPELENPSIPAVFTFVGQFIDHDLTFNGANLFDDQSGGTVPDFASPQVDLDSVYGGRVYPNEPADGSLKRIIADPDVFNPDMSFKLVRLGVNAYDVTRWTDPTRHTRLGAAYIYDPRNDENQLILQIHILIMRFHNALLHDLYKNDKKLDPKNPADAKRAGEQVMKTVIATWQNVLLNDYLPRVCQPDVLSDVLEQIKLPGHGNLKYKPAANGELKMPHEFAIAFRFGHSMLRNGYKLNSGAPISLFNSRDVQRSGDLRGGRPLTRSHVIDWDIFLPEDESSSSLSLKIDSKVTPVVFDLPESAIPDNVKTNANLPFRNLTRSREIELACGEDLADYFGIPVQKRLSPFQVEPNDADHFLFRADVNLYSQKDGQGEIIADAGGKGFKDTRFKTPLWYYILKEAELMENGERLGPLGSRIVAEVICGGIFYGPDSAYDASKVLTVGGSKVERLRQIIDFVNEDKPQLVTSVSSH